MAGSWVPQQLSESENLVAWEAVIGYLENIGYCRNILYSQYRMSGSQGGWYRIFLEASIVNIV